MFINKSLAQKPILKPYKLEEQFIYFVMRQHIFINGYISVANIFIRKTLTDRDQSVGTGLRQKLQ